MSTECGETIMLAFIISLFQLPLRDDIHKYNNVCGLILYFGYCTLKFIKVCLNYL